MEISEREHSIKVLENLLAHYKAREKCEGYYDSTLKDSIEALHYAISSLKTDLKYDLMYEGKDVYTKDDMIAMLTDIQLEFEEGLRCKGCCNNCVNACEDIPAGWFLDFIDAKINSLKENADGME